LRLHSLLLGALSLLAVGCTQAPYMQRPTPGEGSLLLTPAVGSGGYQTQAAVSTYTKSSVNHLNLQLFTVSGLTETPVVISGSTVSLDIPASSLNVPVLFSNLHTATNYRVRAYAYKASGTATSDLISLDASSSLDILVADSDRPTAGKVPVQLIEKTFNATSSVTIKLQNLGTTDHVRTSLYRLVSGSPVAITTATASMAAATFPRSVLLSNLAANSTYRLVAAAENAANSVLASGSVDLSVATDTSAATQSLTLNVAPPS